MGSFTLECVHVNNVNVEQSLRQTQCFKGLISTVQEMLV